MRLLKLNNSIVDIDSQTAIGIDIGTYDFTDPANRKLNVSNSFSIPRTKHNCSIIGFADSVQSISTLVYDKIAVEYSINGLIYIDKGKANVTKITKERIELSVVANSDFWDNLKNLTFNNCVQYAITSRGLDNDFVGTVAEFLDDLATYNIKVAWFKTNTEPLTFYLTDNNVTFYRFVVKLDELVKWVKEYYEENYEDYTFDLTSDIFTDTEIIETYVPAYNLVTQITPLTINPKLITSQMYTGYLGSYDLDFDGLGVIEPFKDISCFDFIKAVMQVFGITYTFNSDSSISFNRIDNIENNEIIDWSGKMQGWDYAPMLNGLVQKNNIRYEKETTSGRAAATQKQIICKNSNLDIEKTIATIAKSYVPDAIYDFVIYTSIADKEAFNKFSFLQDPLIGGNFTLDVYIRDNTLTTISSNYDKILYLLPYGLSGEYTLFDKIFEYPKVYNAKMWIKSIDLYQFDQTKLRYIRELGGSFYVNKIKGFNPELSSQAVDVELIYVNNNIPQNLNNTEVWADGLDNIFVDGLGNYFN